MSVDIKGRTEDQIPPSPSYSAVKQQSPTSTHGDSEPPTYLRIVIDLPPEAAREIKHLVRGTGDDLPDLFRKALGLYKASKEAVKEGKFVGMAESEDSLETEFVGF
jgi:hypothetical protein